MSSLLYKCHRGPVAIRFYYKSNETAFQVFVLQTSKFHSVQLWQQRVMLRTSVKMFSFLKLNSKTQNFISQLCVYGCVVGAHESHRCTLWHTCWGQRSIFKSSFWPFTSFEIGYQLFLILECELQSIWPVSIQQRLLPLSAPQERNLITGTHCHSSLLMCVLGIPTQMTTLCSHGFYTLRHLSHPRVKCFKIPAWSNRTWQPIGFLLTPN